MAWILPRVCAVCGFVSDNCDIDLCSCCKIHLPWREASCYHCGLPLLQANETATCNKCQDSLPLYNRVCVLFNYEQPIRKLIGTLKFGKQLYPARVFGNLLANAVQDKWYIAQDLPEVLIPVPLHSKRFKERGYNQAEEICKSLHKSLNIPLNNNVCIRVKHTAAQSKLKRSQRIRNLTAAFAVNNSVGYKHVAVIDDVVTTGSTIRAMCMVLLASGVECIDVWCVSRA